jgi:hypothetical protein
VHDGIARSATEHCSDSVLVESVILFRVPTTPTNSASMTLVGNDSRSDADVVELVILSRVPTMPSGSASMTLLVGVSAHRSESPVVELEYPLGVPSMPSDSAPMLQPNKARRNNLKKQAQYTTNVAPLVLPISTPLAGVVSCLCASMCLCLCVSMCVYVCLCVLICCIRDGSFKEPKKEGQQKETTSSLVQLRCCGCMLTFD